MHIRLPLLALALLGAAVPASALAKQAPGTYRGATSQKLSIAITVKKGAIVSVRFKVKNSCGQVRSRRVQRLYFNHDPLPNDPIFAH